MKAKVLNKSLFDCQDPLVSQYPLYHMRVDTLDSVSVILTLTVFLFWPCHWVADNRELRHGKASLRGQLIGKKKIKLHLEIFLKPHFVFVLFFCKIEIRRELGFKNLHFQLKITKYFVGKTIARYMTLSIV